MLASLPIDLVASVTLAVVSIPIIIDSVEVISERRHYGQNGIYNYEVLRTYRKFMMGKVAGPIFQALFEYPRFIFLMVFQVSLAAILFSHIFINVVEPLVAPAIGIILLILMLTHLRSQYGLDGSDQMKVIVVAGLFVFYAVPDPVIQQFSLLFIAFQSLLSYFTSGFAKLVSPIWRGGQAMSGIVSTMSYGNKTVSRLLLGNPTLSKLLCWIVIVFECGLPLLVFTGGDTALVFAIVGVAFHLSIALLMHLNSFFWTFISTYPALLFFAVSFQAFLTGSTNGFVLPIFASN